MRSLRDHMPAVFTAAIFIGVAALVGLYLSLAPDAEDRFDRCMALADRAELLETRREEAALICLSNTTR